GRRRADDDRLPLAQHARCRLPPPPLAGAGGLAQVQRKTAHDRISPPASWRADPRLSAASSIRFQAANRRCRNLLPAAPAICACSPPPKAQFWRVRGGLGRRECLPKLTGLSDLPARSGVGDEHF